jgi:hypothetical protein
VAKELHDPAIRERPFDHELPLSASGAARLGVLKDGPTARFQDKQALRSNVPRLAYVDVPSSLKDSSNDTPTADRCNCRCR